MSAEQLIAELAFDLPLEELFKKIANFDIIDAATKLTTDENIQKKLNKLKYMYLSKQIKDVEATRDKAKRSNPPCNECGRHAAACIANGLCDSFIYGSCVCYGRPS